MAGRSVPKVIHGELDGERVALTPEEFAALSPELLSRLAIDTELGVVRPGRFCPPYDPSDADQDFAPSI